MAEKKYIAKGKIANALTSVARDHIVATADDIFDERLQEYQSEINKQFVGGDRSFLMYKDGSNYIGGKILTKPSITVAWRVKTNDGNEYVSSEKNIIVQVGNVVSVSASVNNNPSENEVLPYKLTGDFGGMEVPKEGEETLPEGRLKTLSVSNITSDTKYSAIFYGRGGGLKANTDDIVIYSEEDLIKTALISVDFKYIVYWGVHESDSYSDFGIKNLKYSGYTSGNFNELNTRCKCDENAFFCDFDCTDGRFIYLAVPSDLGKVRFEMGGLSFSDFKDPVTSVVDGMEYNVYVSSKKYYGDYYPVKFFIRK